MTDLSHNDLLVLLVLRAAGAALLVLGGRALGFAPALPTIDLPPDLVLVGVL